MCWQKHGHEQPTTSSRSATIVAHTSHSLSFISCTPHIYISVSRFVLDRVYAWEGTKQNETHENLIINFSIGPPPPPPSHSLMCMCQQNWCEPCVVATHICKFGCRHWDVVVRRCCRCLHLRSPLLLEYIYEFIEIYDLVLYINIEITVCWANRHTFHSLVSCRVRASVTSNFRRRQLVQLNFCLLGFVMTASIWRCVDGIHTYISSTFTIYIFSLCLLEQQQQKKTIY